LLGQPYGRVAFRSSVAPDLTFLGVGPILSTEKSRYDVVLLFQNHHATVYVFRGQSWSSLSSQVLRPRIGDDRDSARCPSAANVNSTTTPPSVTSSETPGGDATAWTISY